MSKKTLACILAGVAMFFMSTSVFAAEATIDKAGAANGLVSIKYSGDVKKNIKVVVEKNADKYVYTVRNNNANNVPLQLGAGGYKISVLENVSGNTYRPIVAESLTVDKVNELEMYKASTLLIDYNSSTKAVPAYKQLTAGKSGNDVITTVYNDVVANYSYDFDKISSLPKDYVPVIDEMYTKKKGICYDYADLMAGTLRSQNIPTKLVMGYAPEIAEYHAWNEVYMGGKWVVVDTTYDAAMKKGGADFVMAKDGTKFKVLKVY